MARPAATAVTGTTLLMMFGPGRAEKIDGAQVLDVFVNTNLSGWITLLCFQLTILMMVLGGWYIYNHFPRPKAQSFVSRIIRRCRAIPGFITYTLFDEIDELHRKIAELDKEADRLSTQAHLDVKDKISWINVAQQQTRMMTAADRQARNLHAALIDTWEAKVFWKRECYLATHFSDWERGVPEDDLLATSVGSSNLTDYYEHGRPCPPPELQAPGPHDQNPRYSCESNSNYPPDAWRPSNEAQPSLSCHLRDGFIISLQDDEMGGENMTFHRDFACQHVRAYLAHNKHRRPGELGPRATR